MGRPQKEPLREVTEAERSALAPIARASSERSDRATRAKILLAVVRGASFEERPSPKRRGASGVDPTMP